MKLKWTLEACREAASKFRTKGEFEKTHGGAYVAAVKNKWLNDICSHMIPLGDKYNRCVYSYEFSDNSVYVGLTKSLIGRHQEHMSQGRNYDTSVKKHMNKTGLIPKLHQLTDYIFYVDAAKKESFWVDEYKKKGWNILNQRPTGSLSLRKSFYTKSNCKKILLALKFAHEVNSQHPNLIHRCKIHGWHAGLIAKLKTKKRRNGYWTKEKCISISKKFSCVSAFKRQQNLAYKIAANKGWLGDVTAHMIAKRHKPGYWTKERCLAESHKHKNRNALYKHAKGAYGSALRNKWLDEFFPKPSNTTEL